MCLWPDQVSSEHTELLGAVPCVSKQVLSSGLSCILGKGHSLCFTDSKPQVGTIIRTWRSFATEWLVSPSNDLYSCSFLIWSHVQPLIRFPQASPLPPRLRHTSPRHCSKLRPNVGSEHCTGRPSLASNLLQSLFLLRSPTGFRWEEAKGLTSVKHCSQVK